MADKKFTDFTLSTLSTGDFVVGYKADGSAEFRAYVKRILDLQTFPQVTGVFGRQGDISATSGDYSGAYITNDSDVVAPTVKDALNVLKQSIFDTGAATVNSVNSVFGRQGTVVGQSGDYKDTGVTNTSTVAGGTVKDALDTLKTAIASTGDALNTRLKDTGAILNYGSFHVALSDATTALTAGTDKDQILAEYGLNVSEVIGYLNTAPTGSTFQFDINMSGSSIFGTKPTIDASELSTLTAATQATITNTYIPSGERLTFDFDQVGSTYAGAGFKVIIRGTKR